MPAKELTEGPAEAGPEGTALQQPTDGMAGGLVEVRGYAKH